MLWLSVVVEVESLLQFHAQGRRICSTPAAGCKAFNIVLHQCLHKPPHGRQPQPACTSGPNHESRLVGASNTVFTQCGLHGMLLVLGTLQ